MEVRFGDLRGSILVAGTSRTRPRRRNRPERLKKRRLLVATESSARGRPAAELVGVAHRFSQRQAQHRVPRRAEAQTFIKRPGAGVFRADLEVDRDGLARPKRIAAG